MATPYAARDTWAGMTTWWSTAAAAIGLAAVAAVVRYERALAGS